MRWAGVALLGVLALGACGRGGGGGTNGAVSSKIPDGAPPPVEGTKDGCACPDGVRIRLLGTTPRDVSSLQLHLGGMAAGCEQGGPIAVSSLATAMLDLSTDAVGHDVGVIHLPKDGGPVTVNLSFSEGTATLGELHGGLDVCSGPIAFSFDPSRVSRDRCLVMVLLDVGRSVVPTSSGLSFLPQLRIFF